METFIPHSSIKLIDSNNVIYTLENLCEYSIVNKKERCINRLYIVLEITNPIKFIYKLEATESFQAYFDKHLCEEEDFDSDDFYHFYTWKVGNCKEYVNGETDEIILPTKESERCGAGIYIKNNELYFDNDVNSYSNTFISMKLILPLTDDLLWQVKTIAYYVVQLDKYNNYVENDKRDRNVNSDDE